MDVLFKGWYFAIPRLIIWTENKRRISGSQRRVEEHQISLRLILQNTVGQEITDETRTQNIHMNTPIAFKHARWAYTQKYTLLRIKHTRKHTHLYMIYKVIFR